MCGFELAAQECQDHLGESQQSTEIERALHAARNVGGPPIQRLCLGQNLLGLRHELPPAWVCDRPFVYFRTNSGNPNFFSSCGSTAEIEEEETFTRSDALAFFADGEEILQLAEGKAQGHRR